MSNRIYFAFVFMALLLILSPRDCFPQWQGDFRLTNNSYLSSTSLYGNGNGVAADGNNVHVVWFDTRDGNPEIYYKCSSDEGVSWGTDTRLTNNSADSYDATVAVSGALVFVAWYDKRDGHFEIYCKRSVDGGTSWGPDTKLTNGIVSSLLPSAAVSGSNIHIVWYKQNTIGDYQIYYKNSTDAGLTWGTEMQLTNAPNAKYDPTIAVSGQNVHVSWDDHRNAWPEIYYKRSTDGGSTWGSDVRLTPIDNLNSEIPSIGVSGSNIHIVWVDGRGNTGVDIYYKHSTDNGLTWSQDTAIVNYNLNSFFPNLAVLGNNLHVVWEDDRENSKHEIYYKRSTNAGFTWDADTRLTFDTNYSEHSFVAVSNSSVHVVWRDNRNSNFEVYYKKDPTGNPIGIQSISSEIPNKFSLYQNYPNPFNPSTKIEFSVPSAGIVKLKVFDFLGREISTPINERLNTGTYSFDFDGSGLASGVYLYQLSSGEYLQTRKMILIK